MKKNNSFIITGGTPLYGCVRLGGAKNASYKLMLAALLGGSVSRLLNLPDIADVRMVAKIINLLGGKAYSRGEKTIFIEPEQLNKASISKDFGEVSRASTLFIPALLHRFKKVSVPLPGGDKIGKRPLERHLEGLTKMGAKWDLSQDVLSLHTSGLKGTTYRFEKNTHTGTETLIMAASLAHGKTILENAALEPEIDDLIIFLNNMGARIRRRAFRVIEIEGVKKLHGAIHKIMPDRNEAVSYACAAIASQGDIIIENAKHEHLKAFLEKVEEAGGGFELGSYGIRFYSKGKLRATDIKTQIHPGFMTDWQPLWAILMTQASGVSIIHETVMQNRFQYKDILKDMGAKIETFQPQVKNENKVYNFNVEDSKESDIRAIKIHGKTKFKGGKFLITDLRAGATALLAAIIATGKTTLENIEQIERGYEDIDNKLISMGAKIQRV